MGFSISVRSLILVSALLLVSEIEVGVADKWFKVTDYGAVGDGRTDDSPAFSEAWNAACNTEGGASTISVPKGKVYLVYPLDFKGPCKSHISLVVSGRVRTPWYDAWKGLDQSRWLSFQNVNGLSISGPGPFDGYGGGWWNNSCVLNPKPGCYRRAPPMLRFNGCSGVSLQYVHIKNSIQANIAINGCSNFDVKFLNISNPDWSPNTDGIDIGSSHGVSVSDSIIGTGDDCIAVGDRTSGITITGIKCGPGHGVSIGSLGKSGNVVNVSNIYVNNVHFQGSSNGARIKTWTAGRGQVDGVKFSNLHFTDVENPIVIDQYYCARTPSGCVKTQTGVHLNNVQYRNAFGTSSTKVAINLNCSENVPCTNIKLDNIHIDSAIQGEQVTSSCNNAFGTAAGIVKPNSCLGSS